MFDSISQLFCPRKNGWLVKGVLMHLGVLLERSRRRKTVYGTNNDSDGYDFLRGSSIESFHGTRSCTFWFKRCWEVEPLTRGTLGLYGNFFCWKGPRTINSAKKCWSVFAKRNFLAVVFLDEINRASHERSSENSAAPLPWDASILVVFLMRFLFHLFFFFHSTTFGARLVSTA